jgi:hypothetical protein
VRYFYDACLVESYELSALDVIRDSLLSHQAQLQQMVVRPWNDVVSAKALEFAVALPCIEYVTSGAEFEGRLRAAAPGVSFLFQRSRIASAAVAAAEHEPRPSVYLFDLRQFELGVFTATRCRHLSVRPHGEWACIARDHEQALQLAQRAALDEWARPATRNPESFTVRFAELGEFAEPAIGHAEPDAPTEQPNSPGILDRLTDANGVVIVGRLEPEVFYARLDGAISDELGILVARQLSRVIGEEGALRLFVDLSRITSFGVKAFAAVADALLSKRAQFKLIVAHTGKKPLGPQAASLATAFGCLEYVASTSEFEARLRPAVLESTFEQLTTSGRSSTLRQGSHSSRPPSKPITYTYVFDLRDFEGGKFIATRFALLAVRSTASWTCRAGTDAQALALALEASIAEWPEPQTRLPEQFTVRFIEPPTDPVFDRRRS